MLTIIEIPSDILHYNSTTINDRGFAGVYFANKAVLIRGCPTYLLRQHLYNLHKLHHLNYQNLQIFAGSSSYLCEHVSQVA